MNGVTYVVDSGNTKIMGSKKVDATYASIKQSCPSSCSLKDGNGCYAEASFVGIQVRRLDKEAEGISALQMARNEANAIDNAYAGKAVPNKRDMRLHVSGDSRTLAGTKLINNAVGRWKKRGGGDCWSYTHAWKQVPRSAWSNVSILASVSNISEALEARKQGYAPAIVVSEHPSEKTFHLEGSDVKWIPCPAQTRGVGCSDCRLCFNADRLYNAGFGIAFAAHGVKKGQIKRRLNVLK
jgi:hypothetical protein